MTGALSVRERFQLAWQMVWPLFLIDLASAVLIFGILEREGEGLESIYLVVSLLVVSPWVMRRALGRAYPSFSIVTLKDGVEASLGYQDSLRVVWLLVWRSTLLALLLLAPLSLLFHSLGRPTALATPSRLVNAVGLSMVDALSGVALFPLLIPGMLRKRYAPFRLEVSRMKTFSRGNVKKELVRGRPRRT